MSLQEMLHWWNLVYLLPLLISVVWILASVLTGGFGHAGQAHVGHAGHGLGHGIGHGIGHAAHGVGHAVSNALHHGDIAHGHANAGAHGHGGHGGDARAHQGQNHGTAHESNLMGKALWILGIGQVPITLVIGMFLLSWGLIGTLTNQFFAGTIKYPAVYIWPSLGITFVLASVITRFVVALAARFLPSEETFGVSRFGLVGALGHTVYPVTERTGTVDIKDQYGTVHRVQAKTEGGRESIPSGKDVVVVDFDEEDKRYIVRMSTI